MSAPRTSPYKGLVPYAEEDAPYFFGREAEREIILANLMASRLTLLYGASGVGKSSVLRAGVAHHLVRLAREEAERGGPPEFLPVVFSDWKDDPVAGLLECVRGTAERVLGAAAPPGLPARPLGDALHAWTGHLGCDLLVVLDQFEEYFLYHGQEDGPGTFAAEFPDAVNRRDLRASFLVSLREDAVAKLDRFKGRIPNLFDNYLRIDFLTVDAARSAIVKPVEHYNRVSGDAGAPVNVEPELVDAVLDEIRTGRVAMGEAGRGGVAPPGGLPADARVETPFLQLVMTRLWDRDANTGERVLRRASLEELGGARQIVRTHLDGVMDGLPPADQETAALVFHHLVTPSGTKIAHTPADLADYTGRSAADIARVLETLSGETRILRSDAPRYEIFHDVLAPAILDWRRRYIERQRQAEIRREAQEREAEREREARKQGRRLLAGLATLGLAGAVAVGIWYSALERNREELEKSNASLTEAYVALGDQAYVDSAAAAQAQESPTAYSAAPTTDGIVTMADTTAAGSGVDSAAPDIVPSRPLSTAPGDDPPFTRSVAPPQAAPPESAPRVASAPADRERRSGVVVRYFQPALLRSSGVLDTLQALGFTVEEAEGRFDAPPNSIAYGHGVAAADVEALALALASAGFPVRRIRPFLAERGRSNVVEVVHSPALGALRPLTPDQIRTLSGGSRRTKARE